MAESFRTDGECRKRQIPVQVFVHDVEDPAHEDLVRFAQSVCRECPFEAECFLFGTQNYEQGVWGGAFLNELPPETSTDKP